MPKELKIGWIGLGNMGTPMSTNLLKAGYDVTVYNRNKEKEQALLDNGAKTAANPAAMINSCNIVFTMLSNDAAVKEVFEGPNGLFENTSPDKLIIDMSTVAPETSRWLSTNCQKHQLQFLEAPVSGSVKPAQDGTLIIMVGGSPENYEKAKPLFDALGKMSLLLGGPGIGSSAKLAINYLLGLHLQGIAETVLFAEKNGVSRANMLNIINESALGNGLSKLKTPSILSNQYPAAFALKHLVKDLTLAKEAGMSSHLLASLFESFKKAEQSGLGESDVMAIIQSI